MPKFKPVSVKDQFNIQDAADIREIFSNRTAREYAKYQRDLRNEDARVIEKKLMQRLFRS